MSLAAFQIERSVFSRQRIAAYLELTKPRLTSLVLVTTAAGYWLGIASASEFLRCLPVLFGTALVAGGASALNQWAERAFDALMRRTQHRPLPSGRLEPNEARIFGWVLVVSGVLLLAVFVNGLAAVLAALSAASYLWLYTPMKRDTSLCTLVGAIPGALPPMIGWSAARGSLGVEAWALFAILFVWQLPHFLAIAVLYKEDYARAGFKMLPLIEADGIITARQTVLYGLALLPVSVFPSFIGLSGSVYAIGAVILGALFFAASVHAALARTPLACRRLFHSSIIYLPLLLALLVTGKTSP